MPCGSRQIDITLPYLASNIKQISLNVYCEFQTFHSFNRILNDVWSHNYNWIISHETELYYRMNFASTVKLTTPRVRYERVPVVRHWWKFQRVFRRISAITYPNFIIFWWILTELLTKDWTYDLPISCPTQLHVTKRNARSTRYTFINHSEKEPIRWYSCQ